MTPVSVPPPNFEQVFRDHGPVLWRIAGLYARDEGTREDLYQEILVALWRALPTFRGDSSLRTFVCRIGHNRGATHRLRAVRLAKREIPLLKDADTPTFATSLPSPEGQAVSRDLARGLREAMASLPEHLAQVTSLRLEGLSAPEIGAVLGISTNNVDVRLHRARTLLRSLLDPEDYR